MSGTAVLIGLGAFGDKVVSRVEDSLGDTRSAVAFVRADSGAKIAPAVAKELDKYLEVGKQESDSTTKRLDIFLFAVAAQGDGNDDLRIAAEQLGDLVGQRYLSMFNLSLPPEQRNAALHIVVWVPPLGNNELAKRALARLKILEEWAEAGNLAGNLLARIWLLPQQTKAGEMKLHGMIASAAAFALSALGSGMRAEEEVKELLKHPQAGAARCGFLSIASLDVPEAAVRKYAAHRAVYDGLQTLLGRVQGHRSIDADAGKTAVASLPHARWTDPFDEAHPVTVSVRKLAANLSGASSGLPKSIAVGAFDSADRIRETYAPLYRPASVDRDLGNVDAHRVEDVLRELDRHEAELVREIHLRVRELFQKKLRADALKPLPEIESGLRGLLAQLADRDSRDSRRLADQKGPPDPHREQLEAATNALPSPSVVRTAALAAGAGLGFLAFSLLGGGSPATAATAASLPTVVVTSTAVAAATTTAPFPWDDLMPWLVGATLSGTIGFGWAFATSHFAREDVRRALRQRLEAVQSLWSRGGGGRRGRQAEDQLELRRHRVRRVARIAIQDAIQRLTEIQLSLGSTRDKLRENLEGMQVSPTADAATDDLSALFGEVDSLHGQLVRPQIVSSWVKQARKLAGDDEWATHLLNEGWPENEAADDIPCGDEKKLLEIGEDQVSSLRTAPLLALPIAGEVVGRAVGQFVQRAVASLAPPLKPLREDFTEAGVLPRPTLVLAPRRALESIGAALGDRGDLRTVWIAEDLPRVTFIFAWDGFRVIEIARGAGLIARPQGDA